MTSHKNRNALSSMPCCEETTHFHLARWRPARSRREISDICATEAKTSYGTARNVRRFEQLEVPLTFAFCLLTYKDLLHERDRRTRIWTSRGSEARRRARSRCGTRAGARP